MKVASIGGGEEGGGERELEEKSRPPPSYCTNQDGCMAVEGIISRFISCNPSPSSILFETWLGIGHICKSFTMYGVTSQVVPEVVLSSYSKQRLRSSAMTL